MVLSSLMGGTWLKFESWEMKNHTQNAFQYHFYCFLKETWILKFGCSLESPIYVLCMTYLVVQKSHKSFKLVCQFWLDGWCFACSQQLPGKIQSPPHYLCAHFLQTSVWSYVAVLTIITKAPAPWGKKKSCHDMATLTSTYDDAAMPTLEHDPVGKLIIPR